MSGISVSLRVDTIVMLDSIGCHTKKRWNMLCFDAWIMVLGLQLWREVIHCSSLSCLVWSNTIQVYSNWFDEWDTSKGTNYAIVIDITIRCIC